MSTPQSRIPSIILPDDGGGGGDDDVDVTVHVSNPHDILANLIGIPHAANKAALPVSDLFTGRFCQVDDTGVVYQYITGTGWVFDHDTKVQTYTPVWHSNGTLQPAVGNGSLQGYFFRHGPELVSIWLEFGSGTTTVNGRGDYDFSVPSNAVLERTLVVVEQRLWCYIFLPWAGWVPATGKLQGPALFPLAVSSQTNNFMSGLRNCDGPGNVGTGIPQKPGDFTMPSTGGAIVQCGGTFRMTA